MLSRQMKSAAANHKEAPERHQAGEMEGDNGSVFNLSDDLFSGAGQGTYSQ